MSDPFVAEIRIMATNFAPQGWALCNGQVMPIRQNTTLYALLGVTYGGDGRTTFALPNMQDSMPMHPGQGPGLSGHVLGESGGSASVALQPNEMPSHSHQLMDSGTAASSPAPGLSSGFGRTASAQMYAGGGNTATLASQQSLAPAGGGAAHNNLQPYLTLNFCIALQGIFPQRP